MEEYRHIEAEIAAGRYAIEATGWIDSGHGRRANSK